MDHHRQTLAAARIRCYQGTKCALTVTPSLPPDRAPQVTKRTVEQVDAPSRDGAFVHGLVLEGCSWDDKLGVLEESRPKQLFTQMPVMLMKAVPAEKEPREGVYQCPVYYTERRFREEVFTAQLKTKQPWTQWAAAGVALHLDVAI